MRPMNEIIVQMSVQVKYFEKKRAKLNQVLVFTNPKLLNVFHF